MTKQHKKGTKHPQDHAQPLGENHTPPNQQQKIKAQQDLAKRHKNHLAVNYIKERANVANHANTIHSDNAELDGTATALDNTQKPTATLNPNNPPSNTPNLKTVGLDNANLDNVKPANHPNTPNVNTPNALSLDTPSLNVSNPNTSHLDTPTLEKPNSSNATSPTQPPNATQEQTAHRPEPALIAPSEAIKTPAYVAITPKKISKKRKKTKPKRPAKKTLKAWQIGTVLFASIVLVSWLKSEQLSNYWQQSYQQNEPWATLSQFKFWQSGSTIAERLDGEKTLDNLGQMSKQSNDWLNQTLNDDEIKRRDEQQKAQEQARLDAQIAAQQAIEAKKAAAVPQKLTHATLHQNQKVFFAGDSMMQGVAPWVMRKLQNDHQIQSVDLSKQSTGLSYSSFFDWPATVETTLKNDPNIGLLIMFLGANDPWAVPDPKSKAAPYIEFATPQWIELYHQKIARILDTAKAHNVQVIWLTPPTMKKTKLNNQMAELTKIMHDGIDDTQVVLLDAKPLLSTSDDYQDSIIIGDKKVKVRTADGIHFTPDGQKHLANFLLEHIKVE